MRAVVRRAAAVPAVAIAALALVVALAARAPAAPPEGPPIVPAGGDRGRPSVQLGEELFAANCVRCHGIGGRGVTGGQDPTLRGPSLRGAGALAADFYLRTGYMPLADATHQPVRSRPRFDDREIRSLVAYVASLGRGPAVPTPDPAAGSVAEGRSLFTDHCAGCHQVVAEGGVLTGAKAPPLDGATPRQVAQAVRIGPYVMPKFSEKDISDAQLNSIVAYVQYTKDPRDEGGWGINHLGPFPEGMIAWLLAIPVLLLVCRAIGKGRSS
jgi:ubiquinol-cytochrome c reductase cytochrome c subunit